MSPHASLGRAISQRAVSPDAFEVHLAQLFELLVPEPGVSVCVATPREHRWVRRSRECVFSEKERPAELLLGDARGGTCAKVATVGPARLGPREVWVWAKEELDSRRGLLASLCEIAASFETLEDQRNGLCDELGASYDTLAAIYKVGSNPDLLLDAERAREVVLDQLLSFDPEWKGGFWLVDGERLVPATWRNTPRPSEQHLGEGILGHAIESRRGMIVDEVAALAWANELEQRFGGACSLLACPIWSRGRALGCLVVWSARPEAFDSRHMGLINAFASEAVLILECARLHRERMEVERLRQELEIGGRIQRTLLHGSPPTDLTRIDVGSVSMPSRHIDGDFFDFQRAGDAFDVVIGDVMGKGLPAALVGAAVKYELFRALAASAGAASAPEAIVSTLNDRISQQLIELASFATMCYVRVEPQRERMNYVDCGHTSALVFRKALGKVEMLHHDFPGKVNLPLGMLRHTKYRAVEVEFVPGDVLVLYSDGVTEAMDASGRMFGVESLAAVLRESSALSANEIARRVRAAVTDFADPSRRSDDLTCIVVRLLPRPSLELEARPGHLKAVREFVAQIARTSPRLFPDANALYRVQLALVEAVANVVKHAYDEGEPAPLRIEANATVGALELILLDRGRSFDPDCVAPPSFDGSRSNGFGVFLLHKTMDEVRYERDASGQNRLTLVWRPEKRDRPE